MPSGIYLLTQLCALRMPAARSAMARTVALVLAAEMEGITDASATRSCSIPCARSCGSVAADASVPSLSFFDDLGHPRISASTSGVSRVCDERCLRPLLELTRRRLTLTWVSLRDDLNT